MSIRHQIDRLFETTQLVRSAVTEATPNWSELVRLYREAARLWDEEVCDYLASDRRRRRAWKDAEALWAKADDLLPDGWDFAWNPVDIYQVEPGEYPVSIDGPAVPGPGASSVDDFSVPSVTYHTLDDMAKDPTIPRELAVAIVRSGVPTTDA